jgi:mannose-6-phosphate isomerase-like protein (cupin superfamily)
MSTSTTYHVVRAATAEVLAADPSGTITLLADAHETSGAVTVNRSFMADGNAGAPPHFHSSCSETFFVLSGSLDLMIGEQVVQLGTGDLANVPAGSPHAFAPTPGHDVDVLVVFAPGVERFDYYRLLDRVHAGAADVSELSATSEKFDNHYVASPAWEGRTAS